MSTKQKLLPNDIVNLVLFASWISLEFYAARPQTDMFNRVDWSNQLSMNLSDWFSEQIFWINQFARLLWAWVNSVIKKDMMRMFLSVLLWLSYWWSLPAGHMHFHISEYCAQIWMRHRWEVCKPLPLVRRDLRCTSGIGLWMENWIEMSFKHQKLHTFRSERHFNKYWFEHR